MADESRRLESRGGYGEQFARVCNGAQGGGEEQCLETSLCPPHLALSAKGNGTFCHAEQRNCVLWATFPKSRLDRHRLQLLRLWPQTFYMLLLSITRDLYVLLLVA